MRYPVEVPLVGDAGETLRELLAVLKSRDNRDWRAKVEGWVRRWHEIAAARAAAPAEPVNPQHVVRALSGRRSTSGR